MDGNINETLRSLSPGALRLLKANTGGPRPPGTIPQLMRPPRPGPGGAASNPLFEHYGRLQNIFAQPQLSQYANMLTQLPNWQDFLNWKNTQPPTQTATGGPLLTPGGPKPQSGMPVFLGPPQTAAANPPTQQGVRGT